MINSTHKEAITPFTLEHIITFMEEDSEQLKVQHHHTTMNVQPTQQHNNIQKSKLKLSIG